MDCVRCGAVCRCHSEPPPATTPRWRPDARTYSASALAYAPIPDATSETRDADPEPAALTEQVLAAGRPRGAESMVENPATSEQEVTSTPIETLISAEPQSALPAKTVADEADPSAWRDELSARLNRYRARRKIRPPRYPSLRLRFDAVDSSARAEDPTSRAESAQEMGHPQSALFSAPAVGPALGGVPVLNGSSGKLTPPAKADGESEFREAAAEVAQQVVASAAHSGAKIIEFPRFAADTFSFEPPPPPPDQLAEPVGERIRILDVPEVEAPPPALGGITIAPASRQEDEKRPGIDIPLQSASLARRILASLIDGLIVAAASAFSGFIFWKVAAIRPPRVQILGLAAAVPCLFWALFQYLLIVYAGHTPGLRAFGLELASFDGRPASRSLRRWRVLASYLSAASLGMGYAWVFLDEDALCWHDRITHTYLAPGKPQPKREELRKA